jgi:hypothetical protein
VAAAGRFFLLLPILFIVLVVLTYVFLHWKAAAANHDFERLLGGDAAITVTAMEISLPAGKRERVKDPELLKYLSEMFRHAEPHEGECGISYQVEFRLSTGKWVNCGIEIPRRCDQITIVFPFNTMGDPDWYAVALSWPIPKDLDELLFKLGHEERPRASAIEYRKCHELFGSHPPLVELDKDLQVVKVSACPLCIWHVPPVYYLPEKHEWLKREDVPQSGVARAESLLNDLKRTRPYSDYRPLDDGANTP